MMQEGTWNMGNKLIIWGWPWPEVLFSMYIQWEEGLGEAMVQGKFLETHTAAVVTPQDSRFIVYRAV